jgi:hypothetical protein
MMMDRSMAHDGATRRDVFKAHVGRIIARMLEYAGVLWAAGCVGSAALEFAIDPRWSDALSDAFPLVLAGGLGFCLAWWMASVARRLATNISRPQRWRPASVQRTAKRRSENRRSPQPAAVCL